MQEESLATQLLTFMQKRHLSQESLAKAAKISQSTVSRALQGRLERQGRAKRKLFTYMQNESLTEDLSGNGTDKVINAFKSIWDGTEEHAMAIAKIIKASSGLVPAKRQGGER